MSFQNTTITEESIEIVTRLIRNDFYTKHYTGFNIDEFKKLHNTAVLFGLTDLAEEMNNDFITEYNTRIDE